MYWLYNGYIRRIKIFSDIEVDYYFPIILVLLNIPSLIYQIFPFIILISVIFLFLNLAEKGELISFKNNGLENFEIIKLISFVSFLVGLFAIIIFYNFAAILKFNYLDIKKNYTKDAKYLASITENGIWIKDEIDNEIIFINAKKIKLDNLIDVEIVKLNNNFEYLSTISAKEVNIRNKLWVIENALILKEDNTRKIEEKVELKTNFNFEKINNLYSDLSSITLWGLINLKEDYKTVNYSTVEIDYQFNKIISYPVYLFIMSLISIVLMMNLRTGINKIFMITIGIFLSVLIYYINHFFGIIGRSETIPLLVSIWIPLLILLIFSSIGLIRINEK